MGISNQTVVIPNKCEPMSSLHFNRPSVERSGFGEQLIFDAWGGRWFRSSEEAVKRGCDNLINQYYGLATDEDAIAINYNDLYAQWNIETTDFGAACVWDPAQSYSNNPEFVFTWCRDGRLFDKFGEPVLMVEPAIDCFPEHVRWEV